MSHELVKLPREDRLDFLAEDLIVQQTAQATWKCMAALETIYRRKLWRVQFASFDAYCKERFNLSGSHMAKKLKAEEFRVAFGSAAKNLTDYQANALRSFRSELRDEIFKRAVEEAGGHDPSAPVIERVGRVVVEEKNGTLVIEEMDEEEDDDEVEEADETAEETDSDISNEEVLEEADEKSTKPKLHPVQRAAEHHRLGYKDLRHACQEDMEDGTIRETAEKMLTDLRAEVKYLEGLLA